MQWNSGTTNKRSGDQCCRYACQQSGWVASSHGARNCRSFGWARERIGRLDRATSGSFPSPIFPKPLLLKVDQARRLALIEQQDETLKELEAKVADKVGDVNDNQSDRKVNQIMMQHQNQVSLFTFMSRLYTSLKGWLHKWQNARWKGQARTNIERETRSQEVEKRKVD